MTPYAQLVSQIVERLRAAEGIVDPPVVPVFAEWEEPDETLPGSGSDLTAQVETALARAGIAVIVYVEGVSVTEQNADLVEVRVQVVENIVKNRHESGTQKANLTVVHCARSALENWQHVDHQEWTPLIFGGIQTLTKGPVMIRELSFTSTTLMSCAVTGQN